MGEETIVFIDGAYLSLIAKHFFGKKPPAFDISKLAEKLARDQGLECKGIFYYTAPPYQGRQTNAEETRRKANYDKFIARLKKLPQLIVREGRCQKLDNSFAQKGVDTLLTIDLARLPLKFNVAKIVLVLCDTDFVPILNELRAESGIKVIIYYYSDRVRGSRFSMSNHILTACDKSVMLDKSCFESSFFQQENKK